MMTTQDKRHHTVNHHASKEQCGTLEWSRSEYLVQDRSMIVYSPSIRLLPEKWENWLGEKWVRKQFRIVWQGLYREWQLVIPCNSANGDITDWRPPLKDAAYATEGKDYDIVVAHRRWDDLGELMCYAAEHYPFLGMTKLNWIYLSMRSTLRFIWRIITVLAVLSALVTLYLVWRRT